MTTRGEATIVPITQENAPIQIHYSVIPNSDAPDHFFLHVIPSLKQDDDLVEAIQSFLAEHPAPETVLIPHILTPKPDDYRYRDTPAIIGNHQGYPSVNGLCNASQTLTQWQMAVEESGIFPPGVQYDRAGYAYFHEKPVPSRLLVPPQDL